MRQIKHRRALPVYAAAGVYALYALVMPLYESWHFLIAALLTAGTWVLADHFVKPKIELTPESEKTSEPPSSAQANLGESDRPGEV